MADTERLTALLDDFFGILNNDPGALDPTSAYYVPDLHGRGAEDVVELLARTLRSTQGSGLYYFSGQRGTGKTTELRRLRTQLNGDARCRAVMVDALEYIGDSHPIELIDLLLVAAVAFADHLEDELKQDFLAESVAQRFGTWLQSEVEISGVSAFGVKGEFRKQQQSLLARIRAFDLARKERFIAECRDFLRDLGDVVRKRWRVQKVVLIVDSLERLRGVGNAADEMFDRVVQVFDGGLDSLRLPEMQVVYSVPPYLPYLSNVKARVPVYMLASVRVCEPPLRARRQPRADGLDTMARLVEKRFARCREVLTRGAIDRLVLASGGDVRQLLRRLLLDAVNEAYYALDRLPITAEDEIVATVIDRHRIEFEQMVVREAYPLLAAIAERDTVDLPKRSDLPVAARFFDIRAVLNYRNGTDWVDLNPLLWKLIDGTAPPSPDAGVAR